MDFALEPAGPQDLPLIRDLAERIWRVHYPGIITPAQIEYMLGTMYAPETLAADMAGGSRYLLARSLGKPAGYLAFRTLPAGDAVLSKLYLLPELHGQGLGRRMLERAAAECRALGAQSLHLFVNKANVRAIHAYERFGFAIAEAVVKDIGNGYVMDDFRMNLTL
jgi:ribosomal protein S18 acetylase RimI-like enzyme